MSDPSMPRFPRSRAESGSSVWASRGIFFVWLAILAWRLFQDLTVHPARLWLDFLFLFLLFGYIVATALGIGRIAVRWFKLPFSNLEFNVVSLLIGLGLLSMSIAVLGMSGWLGKTAIFLSLSVIGFFASAEWNEILDSASAVIRSIRLPRRAPLDEVLLVMLTSGLLLLLLVNTLTPIWDYDALVYHMEMPRQFLVHERIYFDSEIMRSAHPFLGEMLFIVGMVFQLESLARLINLTFAILFVLSTYAFAIRFFNRGVALTAVGILVSTPIMSVWATWASIDFAWAAFETWALYAVWLWLAGERTVSRNWMVLAGVMSGLAASTKYLSLPALLILASIILWKSMEGSRRPWVDAFWNLVTFGLAAGMVMGIWYIKNWIWTGNPIYPLLFGGVGWDALKDQVFSNDYMKTFGMPRTVLNFVLLPYNIYAYHNQFSTLPLEIIHPLLWLACLFPFVKGSKTQAAVAVYAFLYYIWWFYGTQQIRFLLPVYGFLAILAGSVLERFWPFIRNTLKLALIPAVMILILVLQLSVLSNSGVFSYLAGRTSSEELLRNFVDDYRVKEFIQRSLGEEERALFLWDSRGYYCDSRCVPDSNQSHAILLALNSPQPAELAGELRSRGITHIMLHNTDAEWFIEHHDPNGYHRVSLKYFQEQFLPACGKSIYEYERTELFEIVCE